MFSKLYSVLLLFSFLLIYSCTSVYTSSSLSHKKTEHRSIAILPFEVYLHLKRIPKNTSYDDIRNEQEKAGTFIQSQLCYKLIENKDMFSVDVQDPNKTLALLNRNGINIRNIRLNTKEDLARLLGVDAIISGRVTYEKPLYTDDMVAGFLLSGNTATNRVKVEMVIHDGKDGELLWHLVDTQTGSLGSSAEAIVTGIIKRISKNFPYSYQL